MRKKLFGKLLSVALSATMAVTSAVPAYAADSLALSETEADAEEAAEDVTDASEPETESEEKAENGEGEEAEPEEVQDEEAPKEEETAKEVTEKTPEEEVAPEEAADLTEEEVEDEELAELDSINDTTFTFVYNDTNIYAYDPLSPNQGNKIYVEGNDNIIKWDSTQSVTFELRPETGYVFDDISQISATYTYTGIEDDPVDMDNTNYSVTVDEETQVGKLYIPSSFMSSVKKKSNDGKLGITVTVGQTDDETVTPVTKAATFYAKVDHDTINIGEKNAQLLLTYAKGSDAVIDFTGYEYSYFPITDVELYVGEVKPENKKNEADSDEHGYNESYPFKYDAAEQELTILEALVNSAYANGNDITIVGLSNAFTVEQDSTNKKTYGSTLAFAQGTVDEEAEITGGRSIDYENHIIVTATNPTGNKGRQLEKVEYTLTYKDGTTKTNTAEAEDGKAEIIASEFGDETNPLRKIVAKGYYTDVIQYKGEASYTVESSEDGASSDVIQLGEAGAIGGADAAFRYETKKDAVIYVKPTGQNTVTKVEYTIGTGTTKKELTPDESGKCTIPADEKLRFQQM